MSSTISPTRVPKNQEHSRYFALHGTEGSQRNSQHCGNNHRETTRRANKKKRYKKESRKMHTFEGRESTERNVEMQSSRK